MIYQKLSFEAKIFGFEAKIKFLNLGLSYSLGCMARFDKYYTL